MSRHLQEFSHDLLVPNKMWTSQNKSTEYNLVHC